MLRRESLHGDNFALGFQDSRSFQPPLQPPNVFVPSWAYGGNLPLSMELFAGLTGSSPVAAQGPQAQSSVCFMLEQVIPDPSHPCYFYTSEAVSTPTSAQPWAAGFKGASARGLVAQRADAEQRARLLGKEQDTRKCTQPPTQRGCSIQSSHTDPLHKPLLQDKPPSSF